MTNRDLDYHCPMCDKYMFSLRGDTSTEKIREMNNSDSRFCSEKCKKAYKKKPHTNVIRLRDTQMSREFIAYYEKLHGKKINDI